MLVLYCARLTLIQVHCLDSICKRVEFNSRFPVAGFREPLSVPLQARHFADYKVLKQGLKQSSVALYILLVLLFSLKRNLFISFHLSLEHISSCRSSEVLKLMWNSSCGFFFIIILKIIYERQYIS